MNFIFFVQGGIGKNIVCAGAVKYITENILSKYFDKYDFCILASHPYIFEGLNWKVFPLNYPNFFDLIDYKESVFLFKEPYHLHDWVSGKRNLVSAFVIGYLMDMIAQVKDTGLRNKLIDELDRVPDELPSYYRVLKDELFKAEMVLLHLFQQFGIRDFNIPVILFQPYGGWTYSNPNNNFTGRELDLNRAREIYNGLTSKGYFVIHIKADNELDLIPNIPKTQGLPLRIVIALLKKANTFVSVDSFLQHSAMALGVKGVVLWGSTNPKSNGYSFHINLNRVLEDDRCKLKNCMRPAWGQMDLKVSDMQSLTSWKCPFDYICMEYSSEEVIRSVEMVLQEKNKS